MGGVLYLMTPGKNLFPGEIFFFQFHLQDFEKRSESWQVYAQIRRHSLVTFKRNEVVTGTIPNHGSLSLQH
jgi:hypothetical protein